MNRASASALRLLALDVDGVLTDGRLYYGNNGEELKAFNIKDGLGLKLLQRAGISVAIITGRRSQIVERRAAELGIAHVIQGREDKRIALEELCAGLGLSLAQCAYMGDDLPDLGALRAAAIGLAPADAVEAVAAAADWQSRYPGGEGCVREACEQLLHAMDRRRAVEADYQ
ncbi:KdsC family phosphatase [Pseudohaliea rubra]|uniref:KdsC family phosphatase n=1 Tax=Pseudohaliea rubra TaxID=475795 RepID=UPI00054DF2BF|nr:HAD-IIIA family hydrolase [Pseudohaliea rubra]